MKNLKDVCKAEIDYIGELLGLEIKSYDCQESHISITIKTEPEEPEEFIHIESNGNVDYFSNNGKSGGCVTKRINALPVTDFLRSRGFVFRYYISNFTNFD